VPPVQPASRGVEGESPSLPIKAPVSHFLAIDPGSDRLRKTTFYGMRMPTSRARAERFTQLAGECLRLMALATNGESRSAYQQLAANYLRLAKLELMKEPTSGSPTQ
jgi:hypothetical protein